ncbi:MAG TPA: hypothetical protein VII92_18215 [Anaerolineae bacterium]
MKENGMADILEATAKLIIIIVGIAAFVWFCKRIIALDTEMRANAVAAARVEPLRGGYGYVKYVARPAGFFRWVAIPYIKFYPPEILGALGNTTTINGLPIPNALIANDARRTHALDVLQQTMRDPDYGPGSERILPAEKFSGSATTWQAGIDYLKEFYYVLAGNKGTYCGRRFPNVAALISALSPLPQPNGQGMIA